MKTKTRNRKPDKWTPEMLERIRELAEHHNAPAIAKIIGDTHHAVANACLRYGIKTPYSRRLEATKTGQPFTGISRPRYTPREVEKPLPVVVDWKVRGNTLVIGNLEIALKPGADAAEVAHKFIHRQSKAA